MMHYKIGDHVGFVDLASDAGPIEMPLPRRWFILRVYPNRESKVMRAFNWRGISAYLPLYVRTIDRKDPEGKRASGTSADASFRRWCRGLSSSPISNLKIRSSQSRRSTTSWDSCSSASF
jgi:hypothetical protein